MFREILKSLKCQLSKETKLLEINSQNNSCQYIDFRELKFMVGKKALQWVMI